MNITLPFTKSAEICFSMDISGTSAKPNSVQLSLESGSKLLAFKASEIEGGRWKAVVSDVGGVFGARDISYAINVLINGRLITPFRGTAKIENDEFIKVVSDFEQPAISVTPSSVMPESVTPEVLKTEVIEEKMITVETIESHKPLIEMKKTETQHNKPMSLLKTIEVVKPVIKTAAVKESVVKPVKKPTDSLFKVRKTKIIYK